MNVNAVSFNGLWEVKSKEKIGRRDNFAVPGHVWPPVAEVFEKQVEYRPFADETPEQIQEQIDKYDGKIMGESNSSQLCYCCKIPNYKYYSHINVMLGEKLPVSTKEYEAIKSLTSAPVEQPEAWVGELLDNPKLADDYNRLKNGEKWIKLPSLPSRPTED